MKETIEQLLDFFHLCEKLKVEHRNGKTSDNEKDRVASHSWRMSIMVMFLAPFFEQKIDVLKTIKLALIHDLPEAITGDQPYFKHAFDQKASEKKSLREDLALKKIVSNLPNKNREELELLWIEYKSQHSCEAKIVKAIDKIEAQIQHNEADVSIWNEYDRKCYKTYLNKFCDFDKVLTMLRVLVQEESKKKLDGS